MVVVTVGWCGGSDNGGGVTTIITSTTPHASNGGGCGGRVIVLWPIVNYLSVTSRPVISLTCYKLHQQSRRKQPGQSGSHG